MARTKNKIAGDQKEELIRHLYQRFGKRLTHSFECEKLSAEISAITGKAVAANTLRRILGFLKTDFSPSINTLNILAEYSGFHNWYNFLEKASSIIYQPLTLDLEAALYLDFYKIELKQEADMNYHNATRNIAFRILFNPLLLSKLSSSLAKNSASQVYFFERFPYIDALGSSIYKRSIHLYLRKKTDEAQIFGNALLFLSAFLAGNHDEMKRFHRNINKHTINESMHPFVVARFIGSNILLESSINNDSDYWIEQANDWNHFFLRKKLNEFWKYPYFQHMMADYLNLALKFKEGYKIIRTKEQMPKQYQIENGYKEALEIIYQIAAHSSEKYEQWFSSTTAFNHVSPLFKKYFQLQALCVYQSILNTKRKKHQVKSKIEDLIAQTGFTHFAKFLF